jgi:CBS domain-containing protein
MATVHDLLARKGGAMVSILPTDTVLEAARRMNERGIGGLLVVEGGQLAGIFTERDILRRVVALGRDPTTTPVKTVMTSPVITCLPETSVEECGVIMTTRRIRHLPVADARGLVGIITSGDVLAFRVDEQQTTIKYLNNYMFDMR